MLSLTICLRLSMLLIGEQGLIIIMGIIWACFQLRTKRPFADFFLPFLHFYSIFYANVPFL